jgi:hypothetical protein
LTGLLTVSAVWTLVAFTPLSLFSMASIVADEEVFVQFKEESKKKYTRIWLQFRDFFPEHDFELGPPAEESFSLFFKKEVPFNTYCSCLNSIMKRKYNVKLQELPCLTTLFKGFNTDIKNKAPIFDEKQLKAFMLGNMESSYWLFRQAVSIVAFFSRLRLQECQALVLEKMIRMSDRYKITHSRIKQISLCMSSLLNRTVVKSQASWKGNLSATFFPMFKESPLICPVTWTVSVPSYISYLFTYDLYVFLMHADPLPGQVEGVGLWKSRLSWAL